MHFILVRQSRCIHVYVHGEQGPNSSQLSQRCVVAMPEVTIVPDLVVKGLPQLQVALP